MTDIYEILRRIMFLNRDNGKRFTVTDRLDEIQRLLWNSRYRRVNPQGLFHLYAARPIEQINLPLILVSAHVECDPAVSRCFCEETDDGRLLGTLGNAAANAAILWLMLSTNLPENVVIAFTGGKSDDYAGARQAAEYLRKNGRKPELAVVLDVTDKGWSEQADFTIENNFWDDEEGSKLIALIRSLPSKWYFVPADTDDIPDYVYSDRVIRSAAGEDESWAYDELGLSCFSLCLPVKGNTASDKGVLAEKRSLPKYAEAIEKVLKFW